jgi:hypothetical protein
MTLELVLLLPDPAARTVASSGQITVSLCHLTRNSVTYVRRAPYQVFRLMCQTCNELKDRAVGCGVVATIFGVRRGFAGALRAV